MSERLRGAFEEHVEHHPYFGYNDVGPEKLDRNGDGYKDTNVHSAWQGWTGAIEFLSGACVHVERSTVYVVDKNKLKKIK